MIWTMPYVYHMVADDFRGDELLPLNLLATRFPDIHEVPTLHLDYLVKQRDAGLAALGFVFVRHVLVAGPVDVTGLARTRIA